MPASRLVVHARTWAIVLTIAIASVLAVWAHDEAVPHQSRQAAGVTATSNPDANNPTVLTFEHDGRNVAGFVLYLTPQDGSARRIDLGMRRPNDSGVITVELPRLPDGSYRAEVAAYNAAGESPRVVAAPASFLITGSALPAAAIPGRAAPAADAPPGRRGLWGRIWTSLVGDDP